jgi:DNA-binding MarR family transcriptional regulator
MEKRDLNYNEQRDWGQRDRNSYEQQDRDQQDRHSYEQQGRDQRDRSYHKQQDRDRRDHEQHDRDQVTVQNTSSYLLYSAHSAWKRKMDQFLSHHNLTNSQCILLLGMGHLADHSPEVLQNDLTKGVWFDSSTASHAVRALEDAGLISRSYKEGDERSKVAKLTEKGKLKMQEVEKDFMKGESEFFAPLKNRQRDLNKLLRDLLEEFEEESGKEA